MESKKITKNIGAPNYKRIYTDMISICYPDRKEDCRHILSKEKLTMIDVILINEILVGKTVKNKAEHNQKHRSYDKAAILHILEFQKKHKLNNTGLADHFKLSRNTVHKWKKLFLV